jgi:hypothetical protein
MKTLIAVDYLGVSNKIVIRFSFLIPSYSQTFYINPHVPRHFRVSGTVFDVYVLMMQYPAFVILCFCLFPLSQRKWCLKQSLWLGKYSGIDSFFNVSEFTRIAI